MHPLPVCPALYVPRNKAAGNRNNDDPPHSARCSRLAGPWRRRTHTGCAAERARTRSSTPADRALATRELGGSIRQSARAHPGNSRTTARSPRVERNRRTGDRRDRLRRMERADFRATGCESCVGSLGESPQRSATTGRRVDTRCTATRGLRDWSDAGSLHRRNDRPRIAWRCDQGSARALSGSVTRQPGALRDCADFDQRARSG
jgi:hypothetical protein